MSITKHKLVFDATDADGSDNIGAFLRSSDGTLLTHTDNGGKLSLDVNISNTSIEVTATDLDIRDLSFATDSVNVSGSEVSLDAATLAALESITVSATDLDIRDLAFATDSVDVSGSSIITGAEKTEDSAHVSGDIGNYILSVRQDTLAASASDGDYQSFKTDALGRQYINETHQTMTHAAVVVGNTATDLVATDLVNRKTILIENTSGTDIYIGSASVTTANGILLSKGATVELKIGSGINIHGITSSGNATVRVMELA